MPQSDTNIQVAPESTPQQKRNSLIMVIACTLLIAVAQVLIKTGAGALGGGATLTETAIGIFTNPRLFAGYSLYGLVTVVIVLALRHAELSLIYPVIALSYVWVSILSVVVFDESMNAFKIAGLVTIITGVAVLGRGQTRPAVGAAGSVAAAGATSIVTEDHGRGGPR